MIDGDLLVSTADDFVRQPIASWLDAEGSEDEVVRAIVLATLEGVQDLVSEQRAATGGRPQRGFAKVEVNRGRIRAGFDGSTSLPDIPAEEWRTL